MAKETRVEKKILESKKGYDGFYQILEGYPLKDEISWLCLAQGIPLHNRAHSKMT